MNVEDHGIVPEALPAAKGQPAPPSPEKGEAPPLTIKGMIANALTSATSKLFQFPISRGDLCREGMPLLIDPVATFPLSNIKEGENTPQARSETGNYTWLKGAITQKPLEDHEIDRLSRDLKFYGGYLKQEFPESYELLSNTIKELRALNKPGSNHLDKIKELHLKLTVSIEYFKADAIAHKVLVEIDSGKAKRVIFRASDPGNVLYIPVDDVFRRKEKEIRGEVAVAKNIKSNLYHADLRAFLNAHFDLKDAAFISSGIIRHYPDIKTLKNLSAETAQTLSEKLNIPDTTAQEILNLFTIPYTVEVQKLMNSGSNLAINLEEVEESEKIEGKYTVITPIADSNLEKEIRKHNLIFPLSAELGVQLVNGLNNMHRARFIHRDLKPENVLVRLSPEGKLIVEVSDFGKTREVDDEETVTHVGNNRFVAPEGKSGKKAEVFSAGILLIRTLEEELLSETRDILTSPKNVDASMPSKRRGVEKFLVTSKDTPQTETSHFMGKVSVLTRGAKVAAKIKPSAASLTEAENEIYRYIDTLALRLTEKHKDHEKAIEKMAALLKRMTASDPEKRDSMEVTLHEYKAILGAMTA